MGQRVHVLLDRIDRQQRRLQFALLPSEQDLTNAPRPRKGKKPVAGEDGRAYPSPDRSGKKRKTKGGKTKAKARLREKKAKGKRK
jgi:ribonuclease R